MEEDKQIEELGFPILIEKKLIEAGINKVSDLVNLSHEELKNINGIGQQNYIRIKVKMYSLGYRLKDDSPDLDLQKQIEIEKLRWEYLKSAKKLRQLNGLKGKLAIEIKNLDKAKDDIKKEIHKYNEILLLIKQSTKELKNTSEVRFIRRANNELSRTLERREKEIAKRNSTIRRIDEKTKEINERRNEIQNIINDEEEER